MQAIRSRRVDVRPLISAQLPLSRAQEALRTERDKLRHILFQQAEGVCILRTDFTIEYQNKTLRQQIGFCEGVPCYRAFRGADEPCKPCHMHRALSRRRLRRCELDASGGRVFEHTYTPFQVPQEIKNELEFISVSKMDDVLEAALEEPQRLKLKAEQAASAGAAPA